MHHEDNNAHVTGNSNSIEWTSLSMLLTNLNSKDELLNHEDYDKPSFENVTPVRETLALIGFISLISKPVLL